MRKRTTEELLQTILEKSKNGIAPAVPDIQSEYTLLRRRFPNKKWSEICGMINLKPRKKDMVKKRDNTIRKKKRPAWFYNEFLP